MRKSDLPVGPAPPVPQASEVGMRLVVDRAPRRCAGRQVRLGGLAILCLRRAVRLPTGDDAVAHRSLFRPVIGPGRRVSRPGCREWPFRAAVRRGRGSVRPACGFARQGARVPGRPGTPGRRRRKSARGRASARGGACGSPAIAGSLCCGNMIAPAGQIRAHAGQPGRHASGCSTKIAPASSRL